MMLSWSFELAAREWRRGNGCFPRSGGIDWECESSGAERICQFRMVQGLETNEEPGLRENAHLNPRRVMTRSLIGLNMLMMVGFLF
jgi:hypothetical protein